MNKKQITCLNCHQKATGHFCSHCGQSTDVERITFKETIDHILSSVFSFSGPFFSTLLLLIKNPGQLFRAYLGGQRKAFYNPVSFFVLLTAMYLIIRATIHFDPIENLSQEGQASLKNSDNLLAETSQFMVAHINNIMLVLAFTFGVSFKLFFPKQYYFTEYLTIGFYITGIYVFISALYMIVINSFHLESNNIRIFVLFAILLYNGFSLFKIKRIGFLIRLVFASFFSLLLYLIVAFGSAYLIVYLSQ